MSGRFIVSVVSLIVSSLNFVNGARILAVCPTPSISHQKVVRGLALALHEQGHELVVITTHPLNDPNLKNYTEIDISVMSDQGKIFNVNNIINMRGAAGLYEIYWKLSPMYHRSTEQILDRHEVKKLLALNNNETFDLVLLEMFTSPSLLALGPRFNAPIVGFTSLGPLLNTHYGTGNPIFPSHPSHHELDMKNFGSFVPWQRLDNFIRAWHYIYLFENDFIPKQEAIAKKYFGNDVPSLRELQRNVSLIFVDQQLPISFARPNLPNIIEISGFHLSKRVEPLSKNLQKFLDEATQGFVYMSLGSNVKSTMMSDELRGEFVAAFSELPYKVIWKFEDDNLPDRPDNVMIMKWIPQEAILAHPNIKVYIYQGGVQSTEEAVAHGVPLIGLPVMGDQDMQINKMVSIGVARKLEITTVKKDDLVEAINAVATDISYKQRMLDLRSLLKDRPYDLLENAVWWTEHVIRNRGAPYLRSSFADVPWYQRQDMDIVAFLSTALVIVFSLTVTILYKLLNEIVRVLTTQSSDKKIKVK